MRIFLTFFILLFLTGCTIVSRQYDGNSLQPNTISTVYKSSISKADIDIRQAGTEIVQIQNADKKTIELSSIIDLQPGEYTLFLNWWRVIEDKSFWLVGPGASLYPIINANILKNPNPYEITFTAKAGMTYVIDINPTLQVFKQYPNKICLTEEKHNAKGAEGPRLNPTIRYPSLNAKVVACSK